jgi:betaine lipid synthase
VNSAAFSDGYWTHSSFIYSCSWEDPRVDAEVGGFVVREQDRFLSLTSGGCNILEVALDNPEALVAVDMNPAQNALFELRCVGTMAYYCARFLIRCSLAPFPQVIEHCSFDDAWLLFGEGVHPRAEELFATQIMPYLSESGAKFWNSRIRYFSPKRGLYFSGAMVRRCYYVCGYFFLIIYFFFALT